MHMITMRLVGPDQPPADQEDLKDLLAVHLLPADRIEHLSVRVLPGQIDLVFFVLADGEAEALLAAHDACLQALRADRLTDWSLRGRASGEPPFFP
ncbi:hypothetical protein [Streptomyces scopuliridis]|uniref:hypothetical protein n=1 Tax=Streptomyces scopuliridis TaxID=452529 RepID=UPI0036C9A8BB